MPHPMNGDSLPRSRVAEGARAGAAVAAGVAGFAVRAAHARTALPRPVVRGAGALPDTGVSLFATLDHNRHSARAVVRDRW